MRPGPLPPPGEPPADESELFVWKDPSGALRYYDPVLADHKLARALEGRPVESVLEDAASGQQPLAFDAEQALLRAINFAFGLADVDEASGAGVPLKAKQRLLKEFLDFQAGVRDAYRFGATSSSPAAAGSGGSKAGRQPPSSATPSG